MRWGGASLNQHRGAKQEVLDEFAEFAGSE